MKSFFCCFLLFPIYLSAQINESDTLDLKAKLSLTGIFQGGNVETLIFRVKSDLTYKPWKKWVLKTQNSYVYQAFGGDKADEDILSLNFLYFNPQQKWYPFVLSFVSTNFRREIDLRYLLGTGLTYQILNRKKQWLKCSISCEYEQTDYAKTDFNRMDYDGNSSISTFRGTIWINGKYHLFNDKIILTHESYFQPSLEQIDNFRWQADFNLELPIWKFLHFKVNYLHTFESIVIEGQKQDDRFLTFGLSVQNF